MNWLEHKVPPPLVVVLTAVAMWGVSDLAPAITIERSWRWTGGVIVALAGFSIMALAVRSFRSAKTTINPVDIAAASSLVTSGVFGFTRNPMYLGMALLLTGWSVFLSAGWSFLGPLLFIAFITRFQILPEEAALQKIFGEPYRDYRRRVRRWL